MTAGDDNEQRLIAAARKKGAAGQAAFGQLVLLHQARLVRLVQHLLGRSGYAEDVAQEAFVRAYLALDRHPSDAPLWPWLRTIATRLAFNHRRDAGTRKRYEEKAPVRERTTHRLAEREVLEVVLEQLSYPYREILILRHVEELSVRAIAEQLDLGLSATKMRLSRAREEFKRVYDELAG
ncbi:MAG: RNA polymerase sigma factor [Polyangiaceae bacterium]